jgi:hypothetical protein
MLYLCNEDSSGSQMSVTVCGLNIFDERCGDSKIVRTD